MRVLLVVCAVALPLPAAAQSPTPLGVLANVQSHYVNATDYTAKIRISRTSSQLGQTKNQDGIIIVALPGSVRFDTYERKPDRSQVMVTSSIVFDGTTQWRVDHARKEIIQTTTLDAELDAALLFLTAGIQPWRFTATMDTSGTYGKATDIVLALSAQSSTATVQHLSYVIDPSDYHVRQAIVVDQQGIVAQVMFFEPALNRAPRASHFAIVPSRFANYQLIIP